MFGRVTLGTRLPAAEGQARTHQPSKSPGVVLFFRRIRVLRALWAAIANGVSWGFFNFLLSCNDLTVRSVLSHLRSQHHLPQIVLLVLLVARCPCPTARILSAGLYRRKHALYAKPLLGLTARPAESRSAERRHGQRLRELKAGKESTGIKGTQAWESTRVNVCGCECQQLMPISHTFMFRCVSIRANHSF